MTVYCDSSLVESCFVIEGESPCVLPYESKVTSNQGEYISVIRALNMCWHKGLRDFKVFTDSQLLVRQVNARLNKDYASPYRTNNKRLYDLGTLLITLLKDCKAELHFIPRAKNLAGIELEKRQHRRKLG